MIPFDTIKVASWNMGCAYNTALPYVNEIMRDFDILCLSEHGLYPCELYKLGYINPDFVSLAKSSRNLSDDNLGFARGNGGCALLWNKKLDTLIRPLPKLGSDRICVIEINTKNGEKLYIIGVYLPYIGCKIANYREEIECIRNICEMFYGDTIMIIGDWNAQFSSDYGVRGGNCTYTNAKEIIKMLMQYDIDIIDIGPKAKGPEWTFQRGQSKTYIDHCAISAISSHLVTNIEVMHENILNVSDHLPIACEINVNYACARYDSCIQRVAWHRLSKEVITETYSKPLDNAINDLLKEFNLEPNEVMEENPNIYRDVLIINLDNFTCDLVDTIKKYSAILPQVKFDKRLKPYWCDHLSALSKTNKVAWRNWVNAGRPRDPENELHKEYKNAKRQFRSEQRRKMFNYEKEQMRDITINQNIDQKYFWFLVNRNRKKSNAVSPIRDDNGEILTDIDYIRSEWNSYYRQLYTAPTNVDTAYKEFVEEVNDRVARETEMVNGKGLHLEDGPVTLNEIVSELNKMKCGKATGWDGISAEHLQYSGFLAKAVITWLTNAIVLKEEIPISYKKGLLISIPKNGKDTVIKTNNRGITLLTTLYKLMERIILRREETWFKDQNVIDVTQGAGQSNCSSLHTSMLLQGTIAYYLYTVYVAFLDIKRAFDTGWVNGLLFKLLESGMRKKTWFLIHDSYKDYECAAYVGGKAAPWFKPERGVHQGAPLSMPLYQVFVNELLQQIRNSKFAIKIYDVSIGAPSFADDISMPTLWKSGLNRLLHTAFLYSQRWQFEYNLEKSVAMIWGKDNTPQLKLTFGNHDMKIVEKTVHVGIALQTQINSADSLTADIIKKAKCTLLAARGIGSMSIPMPPSALSKMYWTIAMSRALYGTELTPYERINMHEIENAHRQNAKIVQGLPGNIPRPSPLMPIGWISIQSYIDIKKIIFLLSILTLPMSNLYRKIVLQILLECSNSIEMPKFSPVACMFRCVMKYELHTVLIEFIMNGGGNFNQTKVKIKKIVWDREVKRWKSMKFMYPQLDDYYKCLSGPRMNIWWKYVDKHPNMNSYVRTLMAVLMGGQPKGLQCNFVSNVCKLCTTGAMETPAHVMFACPALQDTRNNTWPRLLHAMPNAMAESMTNSTDIDRFGQMLSCYGGSYIDEWEGVYSQTVKMVHQMYRARYESYKAMETFV